MITIGFTGTRNGMTEMQERSVRFLIGEVSARVQKAGQVVHGLHGDCLGADAGFALLCKELEVPHFCRPCTFSSMRAMLSEPIAVAVRPMERNRAIVSDATVMIACPPNLEPIKSGSGTWATIGFTQKAGKPLAICWPTGDNAIEFRSFGSWVEATCGRLDQTYDPLFANKSGGGE